MSPSRQPIFHDAIKQALVEDVMNAASTTSKQAFVWSAARGWLTLYRQLFAWIVAFNLTAAVLAAAGTWDWAHRHRVQFAVANTLITVTARNEVSCRHLVYAFDCRDATFYCSV